MPSVQLPLTVYPDEQAMQSVIVSDFGVTLGQTSERLVVRGPKPRLELVEGGPQLLLPLDLPRIHRPPGRFRTS